jgi:DNA-binding PadR family transcriptional regulator
VLTNTELAILSLIVEQPRHGYEIEQVILERGMRDWTEIGFSSIYYILKKLQQNGWLRSRLAETSEQGPARKVYSVTEAGYAVWREAILNALSTPPQINSSFQLGLANLPGIPRNDALAALRNYRDRLAERHDYVKVRWTHGGESLPDHVNGMFDLSVTLLEAELQWLGRFIQRLENQGDENDGIEGGSQKGSQTPV